METENKELRITRESLEKQAVEHISPESDDGNNEYKLKLLDKSDDRIEQLTTQMRYRMEEGDGEAIYTLGISDNGGVIGLTGDEYQETKRILDKVADKNNYIMSLISEQKVDSRENKETRKIYEFLVRERNPNKYVDIKVAFAGNVDAGKTSLMGSLLTGEKDNGRGSARLNVFNFGHEIKTGRTSSIAQHILGFDAEGKIVNYDTSLGRKKSWPDIVKHSEKIVTMFDLCGHEKYLKTTIIGLTSHYPDLAFIMIGANMGVTKMTKEHIFLCLSLKIPFVIVITKIDFCPKNILEQTKEQVKKLCKLAVIARHPCDVKNDEDVITSVKNIHSMATVPIFYISNVSGECVDYIRQFLNLVTKKIDKTENQNQVEFHIDQTFSVSGVGTVVGGQLVKGKIKVGDKLILGPNNDKYRSVQIRSIHVKRVSVDRAEEGCYVCLALKKIDRSSVHRGNVILSTNDKPYQVKKFSAEVYVLKSSHTTVKPGYEPVVNTCSIRQTARIVSVNEKVCNQNGKVNDDRLRSGDRAKLDLEFHYKPEYIKPGFRLLLSENKVKIIGKIVAVEIENCQVVYS